jgi:hypothetical protein
MVATQKEPARAKESLKKVANRLRFRRFSTEQLLIVLALFFICAPFVEEIKGGPLIVSFLVSLVLLAAVLAVANLLRFVLRAPSVTPRGALCEHFGLSDARFNVDVGLLACGPIDARRSLLFQHEVWGPLNERVQWLLL